MRPIARNNFAGRKSGEGITAFRLAVVYEAESSHGPRNDHRQRAVQHVKKRYVDCFPSRVANLSQPHLTDHFLYHKQLFVCNAKPVAFPYALFRW